MLEVNYKIHVCLFWRMPFYSLWFIWFMIINYSVTLAGKVVQAEWKRWFEEDWFSGVDMKKLKLVMFMCYLWWKLLNWPNYRCVWSSLSSLHFGVWEWFVHYRFLVLHEATIPKFMSCLYSSIISGLSILFVFFPEVCMILTRTFLGVTKYLCVLNFDLNILW